MTIALTHSGTAVYSSSSPSREVLVGTAGGIVTLERLEQRPGSKWRVAADSLKGSHISAIIMPEAGLMLAGIYKGGIMMSRDGAKTWERRDDGIVHRDVYSLGATRLEGRLRLFAGTEPAHFYISDDLGASWREAPALRSSPNVARWTFPGPPHDAHVKVITVAPDDPATIYASVEQGDLLKSVDAGETWHQLTGFGPEFDSDVHRLVIHPKTPRRLYMMGGMGLWVSDDGGNKWERRTDAHSAIGAYPDQLTYLPSRADMIIASGARGNPPTWFQTGSAGSRIGCSRDAGRTWEIMRNGLPAPEQWQSSIEAMSLEEWGSSFSVFVATTAGEVFASDDGGESWALIANGLAPISKWMHYRVLNRAA